NRRCVPGWVTRGGATTTAGPETPSPPRSVRHTAFVAALRRCGAVSIDATREGDAVAEDLLLAAALAVLRGPARTEPVTPARPTVEDTTNWCTLLPAAARGRPRRSKSGHNKSSEWPSCAPAGPLTAFTPGAGAGRNRRPALSRHSGSRAARSCAWGGR